MNITLAETLKTGINNPDCAFFVGQWSGAFLGVKLFITAFIIMWIFRFAERVLLEPSVEWVKKKLNKGG